MGVFKCPVVLLGVGGVGRALLAQIIANRGRHRDLYGIELQIRGVGDRSCLLSWGSRAADEDLLAILEQKKHRRSLDAITGLPAEVQPRDETPLFPSAVWVDCSASIETAEQLENALSLGGRLVLANKKPLAGPLQLFRRLTGTSPAGRRCRWEATVGAGLPVLAALEQLDRAGDAVTSVRGALSSTLGFLMTGLQEGCRFSELVASARDQGYVEPDPREDLSGRDMARKALILARTLGWELEMEEVGREALFPSHMQDLTVEGFWARLPELDGDFEERRRKLGAKGLMLRYAAQVEKNACRVGLTEVAPESPLGRLRGPNQIIEIRSGLYEKLPMILEGRGRGAEATAAGVLSDVVASALEFRAEA